MVMSFDTEIVESARNHSNATIVELRDLLSGGARLVPDPKRQGFYEVTSDSTTYYIRISPVNGNVLLLATWPAHFTTPQADPACA
jgi:hypothetical protein